MQGFSVPPDRQCQRGVLVGLDGVLRYRFEDAVAVAQSGPGRVGAGDQAADDAFGLDQHVRRETQLVAPHRHAGAFEAGAECSRGQHDGLAVQHVLELLFAARTDLPGHGVDPGLAGERESFLAALQESQDQVVQRALAVRGSPDLGIQLREVQRAAVVGQHAYARVLPETGGDAPVRRGVEKVGVIARRGLVEVGQVFLAGDHAGAPGQQALVVHRQALGKPRVRQRGVGIERADEGVHHLVGQRELEILYRSMRTEGADEGMLHLDAAAGIDRVGTQEHPVGGGVPVEELQVVAVQAVRPLHQVGGIEGRSPLPGREESVVRRLRRFVSRVPAHQKDRLELFRRQGRGRGPVARAQRGNAQCVGRQGREIPVQLQAVAAGRREHDEAAQQSGEGPVRAAQLEWWRGAQRIGPVGDRHPVADRHRAVHGACGAPVAVRRSAGGGVAVVQGERTVGVACVQVLQRGGGGLHVADHQRHAQQRRLGRRVRFRHADRHPHRVDPPAARIGRHRGKRHPPRRGGGRMGRGRQHQRQQHQRQQQRGQSAQPWGRAGGACRSCGRDGHGLAPWVGPVRSGAVSRQNE